MFIIYIIVTLTVVFLIRETYDGRDDDGEF